MAGRVTLNSEAPVKNIKIPGSIRKLFKQLTQACKKALVRIFKICDQDNDGLLNDYELNNFQIRCFSVPLTPHSLQDVKRVVQRALEEGIRDESLTLNGFLFLHMVFIQRGRHETVWTVLRRFGYDNKLQLSKEYLYPMIRVQRGCSTELSYDGFQFLTALFEKYDEDKDGCLSPTELHNLFSVCPSQPWGPEVANAVLTNEQGWITYNGYLAYWVFTTLLDLPKTLELLAYLGYVTNDRDQTSAITTSREKREDLRRKESTRNVFQCHVIGPKGVGKTAFIQGFLGRNLRQLNCLNRRMLQTYTVNTVSVHGQEKYLIQHEIDVLTPRDPLSAYEQSCDVACLMYDVSNPHSFEYCAQMYKRYFHKSQIPCLVIAAKSDRKAVIQEYEFQPAQFCQMHRLPPPIPFSAQEIHDLDMYNAVATLAVYPHMKNVYYLHDASSWVKFSLFAAVLTTVGFVVYKNL